MAGYVIVDMDVSDGETYRNEYMAPAAESVVQYGGRYLVRGGNPRPLEGDWEPSRIVILEFETPEQARQWYESPEYQAARDKRRGAAVGNVIVVEGAG
jgi:uncharacterized protein (DUF1330 family)